MDFDYDLFVVGGGSGGVRAARIAAAEGGARVGLAEESRMGGTCVIRGCVPKKLMVHASGLPEAVAEARAYGWDVAGGGDFDWPRFRAALAAELNRLETAYRGTLLRAGVTIHDTRAVLEDAHSLRLSDGSRVTARHILIATGGRPFRPDVPGGELALTSDDMFHLPALPARALIVGAGFIACEFAGILHGFGARVTLAFRAPQILRGFDDEARVHVAEGMAARGISLRPGCEVEGLSRGKGGAILARMTDGSVIETDLVLHATGRRPNTAGLGLEALGITLGAQGEVPVDGFGQSAVPSIFAAGDVTGHIALTPVAIREGHAIADTLFNARPTKVDHDLVPSAVFARPELGSIGLTEEKAAARGPADIYIARFRPMLSAFAGNEEQFLMKLVVDATTRTVLGCHLVGPGAAEMIQLAAVAIRMGATKEDFDRTVAVHPTAAEELVTMRHPVRRVG